MLDLSTFERYVSGSVSTVRLKARGEKEARNAFIQRLFASKIEVFFSDFFCIFHRRCREGGEGREGDGDELLLPPQIGLVPCALSGSLVD